MNRAASAAAALLSLHAALALTSMQQTSPTWDEPAHLGGGYAALAESDFRAYETAQLSQRWLALPLLLLLGDDRPELPIPHRFSIGGYEIGERLIYSDSVYQERRIFWCRAMNVLLSLVLGAAVFGWSRRLFGDLGAFLSVALYSFSPTMLAHAGLATPDLAVALAIFVSLVAAGRALEAVTPVRVLVVGACFAVAILTKASAVTLVPTALALALYAIFRRRGLLLAVGSRRRRVDSRAARAPVLAGVVVLSACVGFSLGWAAYAFRYDPLPSAATAEEREALAAHVERERQRAPDSLPISLLDWLGEERVLPRALVDGYRHYASATLDRPTFMRGAYSRGGWLVYFPFTFLVKTPLPMLLAFALGMAGAAAQWTGARRSSAPPDGVAPLVAFGVVYGAASLASEIQIGHRHLLPLYPVLFVLAGGTLHWTRRRRVVEAALLSALVGGAAICAARAWPHYLSYFNALAGGSANGYRLLVDSSVDWGQDLPALRDRLSELRSRRPEPVYLSYFGSARPRLHGIDATRLPGYEPGVGYVRTPIAYRAGLYCISATMLQQAYSVGFGGWTVQHEKEYQWHRSVLDEWERRDAAGREALEAQLKPRIEFWRVVALGEELRLARLAGFLRTRPPDARAGNSILIYELTDADLERALNGPPVELLEAPAIRQRSPRRPPRGSPAP